jgi:hypothetical protein
MGQPMVVKPRAKGPLFVIMGLALLLIGGAVWWLIHDQPAAAVPEAAKPMTDLERVNRRAAELRAQAEAGNTPKTTPSATPVKGVIPWDQRDVLIGHDKRTVTITGPVSKTARSNSGKTIYLIFSDDPKSARVGILLGGDTREAAEKRFESLVGKKVEATGTVKFNNTIGNRPEIIIDSLDDLKPVD